MTTTERLAEALRHAEAVLADVLKDKCVSWHHRVSCRVALDDCRSALASARPTAADDCDPPVMVNEIGAGE